MTYFLFSITNKCNKACSYCIVRDYVNNPAYPDKIDKEAVFSYFAKRAKAGDLVEITGGEPTLAGWLEEFIKFLEGKNIYAVLRTNGFKLFKNAYKNLVVAYNPHIANRLLSPIKTLKAFVKKWKYLKCSDIVIRPKITDSEKPNFKNDKDSPLKSHPFEEMRFVTADGNIRAMSCSTDSIGSVWEANDTECVYMACPHCSFILGAWNLICRLRKR
jgi:organic radical activating enzyme